MAVLFLKPVSFLPDQHNHRAVLCALCSLSCSSDSLVVRTLVKALHSILTLVK